jgi:hypothetical protein
MVRDFVLSLIRTYIPLVVAGALTWIALALDLDLTEDITTGVTAFVVLAVTGFYYLIARFLETKWTWLSVLLGTPPKTAAPTYGTIIEGEVVHDAEVAGR